VSLSILSDGGRYLEQLRAECQTRMLGSGQVDLEAHFLPFQNKLDHAPTLDELRRIADGQNSLFVQVSDNLVKSAIVRKTQKKNLAIARLLRAGNSFGDYGLAAYRFACKRGVESGAEGILPENADSKRVALGRRNLPRPFDKSAKVIEVGGFHFVVSGSRILRLQRRTGKQYTCYDDSYKQRTEAKSRRCRVTTGNAPVAVCAVKEFH